MSVGPIAVVSALPEEIGPLARRLAGGRPGRRDRVRVRAGGREAVLAVTGDGGRAARDGAEALLERVRPEMIIGIGVAGGLSPDLAVAGMVAAREVAVVGRPALPADAAWLGRVLAGGRAVAGRLVSVDRVVATADAKRRLWRQLGRPPCLAVDLESAAWAAAAAGRGVPWLVVRAISDAADEDLPLPLDRLGRPDGGVSRRRVAAYLALRPGRLPAALALRRRVGELAAQLAALVEELLV